MSLFQKSHSFLAEMVNIQNEATPPKLPVLRNQKKSRPQSENWSYFGVNKNIDVERLVNDLRKWHDWNVMRILKTKLIQSENKQQIYRDICAFSRNWSWDVLFFFLSLFVLFLFVFDCLFCWGFFLTVCGFLNFRCFRSCRCLSFWIVHSESEPVFLNKLFTQSKKSEWIVNPDFLEKVRFSTDILDKNKKEQIYQSLDQPPCTLNSSESISKIGTCKITFFWEKLCRKRWKFHMCGNAAFGITKTHDSYKPTALGDLTRAFLCSDKYCIYLQLGALVKGTIRLSVTIRSARLCHLFRLVFSVGAFKS